MLCSSANGNLLINTILIETKIPRTYKEHLECNLQNEGNYILYYRIIFQFSYVKNGHN
jgi:hypothetical protein